jgi:hypothetical protein
VFHVKRRRAEDESKLKTTVDGRFEKRLKCLGPIHLACIALHRDHVEIRRKLCMHRDQRRKEASTMAAPKPETIMRMYYCAAEIGHQMTVVDINVPSFTLLRVKDRTVHAIGVGAAFGATKTVLAAVDPTITSAV